jgi:tetratricopeptide (TPR) repeat protein
MRPTSLAVLLVLGVVSNARPTEAQESAFLAAVSDLVSTPASAPTVHDRMAAALATWDREIARAQARLAPSEFGIMLRRRGRLQDALRQFDIAAARQPSSDVELLRALTLDAAGKPDEARSSYRAASARDAANPVKAYLAFRGMPETEVPARESALGALRAGFERILSGDYSPAAPPFLVLDLLPDGSSRVPIAGDARLASAFAQLASGRLDEAVARLANRGPSAAVADSARERIARGGKAEREGRLAEARRDYRAAIDGTLSGRYALWVGIARLAQVDGDSDAALDAFGQAVRLNPNEPALHREFAAALVAADRFDDAFAELVAALLVTPNDAEALAAIGQLFLDTDRPGEAIAPLRRALAVKNDRYQTHYALARALSRAGQTDDAAREFEQFDRLNRQALDSRRRAVAGQGPDGAQR